MPSSKENSASKGMVWGGDCGEVGDHPQGIDVAPQLVQGIGHAPGPGHLSLDHGDLVEATRGCGPLHPGPGAARVVHHTDPSTTRHGPGKRLHPLLRGDGDRHSPHVVAAGHGGRHAGRQEVHEAHATQVGNAFQGALPHRQHEVGAGSPHRCGCSLAELGEEQVGVADRRHGLLGAPRGVLPVAGLEALQGCVVHGEGGATQGNDVFGRGVARQQAQDQSNEAQRSGSAPPRTAGPNVGTVG